MYIHTFIVLTILKTGDKRIEMIMCRMFGLFSKLLHEEDSVLSSGIPKLIVHILHVKIHHEVRGHTLPGLSYKLLHD